ncbi:MAG: response regulator transcription factor [Cyanobacteria bacterium SZAS LIN-2]|nr:response regulator transcription factor [Cyanobacteria bacterium SZAS LIN-2]
MKILIVDDDLALGEALKDALLGQGYTVEVATSGEDALQLLTAFEYDLILLDWNLPGMNGLSVCRQFREANGLSYIIFLTSESDISKKEDALDAGGDDYLVKPFEIRELLARMRSVTRRSLKVIKDELKVNQVVLQPEERIASCNNKKIQLTPKEALLLEFLMRHPDRPYTGQRLFNAIWPSDADVSAETVKVWMSNLRGKLSKIGQKDFVKTVVGSGYVVESEP